jgi:hypothetical protein
MLFKDFLDEKNRLLKPEFDRLINDAFKNQTHKGDLLLIEQNGWYNPQAQKRTEQENKFSPYMIGPGTEGHSEYLHDKYLGRYVKNGMSKYSYPEYKRLCQWAEERGTEILELIEDEAYSIQTEMLIYLKIWEGDAFLKKLYQLVRLSEGQEYDWHFSVAQTTRDANGTATRDVIIRKLIRDKLKDRYPNIYTAIKNAYKGQIRNSIGHSKYAMFGRFIHLNNFIANDPYSQIQVVTFDEWIDMMADTLVIYTQQTRLLKMIDQYYNRSSSLMSNLVQVRINRRDPIVKTEYHLLKRYQQIDQWNWLANELFHRQSDYNNSIPVVMNVPIQ